jgi:trimeric autotransporter adhesin
LSDLADRATDIESQWEGVEKDIADGTLQPGAFDGDAGGERITGVAAGIADSDGVNVGQMTDMLADAVEQAQKYTDQQAATFNSSLQNFKGEVGQRFKRQNERLDRIGAMNAASTHMAINAAGAATTRGRGAVGVGAQKGKSAVSIGYARPIGERTHLSIGGSFSGPEKSAGIGLSVSL